MSLSYRNQSVESLRKVDFLRKTFFITSPLGVRRKLHVHKVFRRCP